MKIDTTRYGYIYRITNLLDGKTYIGKHKIKKNEEFFDYMGSGRLICYAINKYGIENFKKEIICYTDLDDSLSILEYKYIDIELSNNKSEYNIQRSESSLKTVLENLDFSDEDLLKWYFEDEMSYNDIAIKLNCSIPTIYNYMEKFRQIDERFKNIKHGDNRGKSTWSPEAAQKGLSISNRKIKCENCSRQISFANYSRHLKACLNGTSQHECYYNNCEQLIGSKSKLCKKHFLESLKNNDINNSKNFGDSVKQGGITASHNRWHVKRNIVSDKCSLCKS